MPAPAFSPTEPLPTFDTAFGPLVGVTPVVIRRSERDEPDFSAEAAASPHDPPALILWTSAALAAFLIALYAAGVLA
jgi:hypothetical protein